MAWAISERTELIKDDTMDGRLSSLRPTFVTKVKDMLDAVRWLIVKARFADLRIFQVQSAKYHYKENLPMSKCIVRCLIPSKACCL